MTDFNSPATEAELHAYVDGELPADRREAVASWLAEHPGDAATVVAWRSQAEAIRARYGATVDEPVPARLKLDEIMRHSGANRRSLAGLAAVAAVAAFFVVGSIGWFARGASAAAPTGYAAIT